MGHTKDYPQVTSYACVRGSPMVPLVCNICMIGTNLITNGTIGKETGANGKNGNTIGTNGTNVTNQWYHWENPEHMLCFCSNIRKREFPLIL